MVGRTWPIGLVQNEKAFTLRDGKQRSDVIQ